MEVIWQFEKAKKTLRNNNTDKKKKKVFKKNAKGQVIIQIWVNSK